MRVIPAHTLENSPELYAEVAEVLRNDGLACFPTHRQYCVAAALESEQAVIKLVQSKHRAGRAPSLVFVARKEQLAQVAAQVPASAELLAQAFWPGPLTIMLSPNPDLPSKVLKTIAAKKNGMIGVRVPSPGIALRVVQEFGAPLLISSANLSKKTGSTSASYVRKEFQYTVDLMIDAGDLVGGHPSTLVQLDGGFPRITREGRITAAQIAEVVGERAAAAG